MENARRRWPAVRIVTRYALVQGPQACEQLIAAVATPGPPPRSTSSSSPAAAARWKTFSLLRRGPDSRRSRLPYAGGERHRARVRQPDPGPGRRLPRLDTDRCGKAVVPDVAEEKARVQQARQRMVQACRAGRPPTGAARRACVRARCSLIRLQHSAGVTSSWPNSDIAQIGPIGSTIDRESALLGHPPWRGYAQCRRRPRWIVATRSCCMTMARRFDRSIRSSVGDDLLAQLADGQLAVKVMQLKPRGGA